MEAPETRPVGMPRRRKAEFAGLALAGVVAIAAVAYVSTRPSGEDCARTSVGLTPLDDLGNGTYMGFPGGLYDDGMNSMPASHLDDGLALGSQVVPVDSSGAFSPQGKVVLLSIGFSNPSIITQAFIQLAASDAAVNPDLVIVNGDQGGRDASMLASPTSSDGSEYWNQWVPSKLSSAGVDAAQVEVVWLYETDASPGNANVVSWAQTLSSQYVTILQILHSRFPNLKLVYMTSREYAGYSTSGANPEPYSYATGFAVKWAVGDQINGSASLNYNATRGPVEAPWVAWGPYTWADGTIPRSDGLSYVCSDFSSKDGLHPSVPQGADKIANLLLAFFSTDPTATVWFLKGG